jgi:glycerol uptake facilitator-like aquaporin
LVLVFVTSWAALRPLPTNATETTATDTSPIWTVWNASAFAQPLFSAFVNWITVALLIYTFAAVSGAHLNPTITFATFFARLITLPRMVLYILAQTTGGALGGLALSKAYGSGEFQAGGCAIDTSLVPIQDAFVLEFFFTLSLILLAFGVGLDPRQTNVISPTFSPWLVGIALGILGVASAYTRVGYSGASQ